MAASNMPMLLQSQLDMGLRIKRPKATPDFYKHIYVYSNDRANQNDPSTKCEIRLAQPIETPPDGTTVIKLHRCSVPYTYPNIVHTVGFLIEQRTTLGVLVAGSERIVLLPRAWYNQATVIQTMQNCLANADLFAAAPLNGANIYTVQNIGNRLVVTSNPVVAGTHVVLRFIDYTNLRAALNGINPAYPGIYLDPFPWRGTDPEYVALCKSTFGFDGYVDNNTPLVAPDAAATISPSIFGPFQDYEIFLRIDGVPMNQDLLDAGTGLPTNILAIIPQTAVDFGAVMTLPHDESLVYTIPPSTKIQRIVLTLTHRDHATLVDLQGQDFSCILSIIKEGSIGA